MPPSPSFSDDFERITALRQLNIVDTTHDKALDPITRLAESELLRVALEQNSDGETGKLIESEGRFRLLANSLPHLIWTCRPDGQCDFLSQQWIEFTGIPEATQLGSGWLEQVHPDDRERTGAAWQSAHGAGHHLSVEFRIRRHDGVYRFFDTRAVPLRDSDAQIVKWFGTNTDITARKDAERSLFESEQRLLLAMDAAQMGSFDWDIQTNKVLWSPQHEILWGYEPGTPERGYQEYRDRVHPEDIARVEEAIQTTIKHRKDYHCEYRLVWPDGSIRWIAAMGRIQCEGQDNPIRMLGMVFDITERKRAEQKVLELNEELEARIAQRTAALSKANENLRAEIAARRRLEKEIIEISEREQQRIGRDLHDDVGQRLVGMWMLLEGLKHDLGNQNSNLLARVQEISEMLKDAHGRTRLLARGLFPVELMSGELTNALVELAISESERYRVHCSCQCPARIAMDNITATHLYRIAKEAVTNAVTHGNANRISIELSAASGRIELFVKDNGKGMSSLDGNHLGMGLHIMRYRADIMTGTLTIRNDEADGGVIVCCTIPSKQVSQTEGAEH